MSVQWGLSVLDWHHHAIDDRRCHPNGVYKAECGHLLMMVTPLNDEAYGRLCQQCAGLQLEVAQAALERAATGLQLAHAKQQQPTAEE